MRARSRFILLGFVIVASAILFHGCNKTNINSTCKIKSGDSVSLVITSDIHYVPDCLRDDGDAFKSFVYDGDGKQLDYIDEIIDAFIFELACKKPDILVIAGDLTCNGAKEGHLKMAERLMEIEKTGTSVFVIPGNHDIQNPWARCFKDNYQYKVDNITSKDFKKIYWDYGYNESLLMDRNSLSYLVAPSEDIWLLMLDTCLYDNNNRLGYPQIDGAIGPKTLKWIEKCCKLAKENNAQIIPVMHHNLLMHCNQLGEGYTLNNNQEVIELLKKYGIRISLSAHIHNHDIKCCETGGDTIYDIALGALSVYPMSYGNLEYSRENGYEYHTARLDVESWARMKGVVDENLNNFKEFTRKFFMERALYKAYSNIENIGNLSEKEKSLMAETLQLIYLKHFEGLTNLTNEEITNTEGFKLWQKTPECCLKTYVMDVINEDFESKNKLKLNPLK